MNKFFHHACHANSLDLYVFDKNLFHASFNFYEINKFAYLFIGFDVSFVFCCVEKEAFVREYKA